PPCSARNVALVASDLISSYAVAAGTTALPSPPLTTVLNGRGSPPFAETRSTWDASFRPLCRVHLSPRSWTLRIAAPSLVATTWVRAVSNLTVFSGGLAVGVPRGTSGVFGVVVAGPAPDGAGAGAAAGGAPCTAGSALCCAARRPPTAFGKNRYSPNMQASQMATATSRFWFWFFMRVSFARAARGQDRRRPTDGNGAAAAVRARARSTAHARAPLPARTGSSSGSSGKPLESLGRSAADRPRSGPGGAATADVPSRRHRRDADRGPAQPAAEVLDGRIHCARARDQHQIHGGERGKLEPDRLSKATLDPVSG